MSPAIGLIIALPAEAAAVTGGRWRGGAGYPCRRETLPGGIEMAVRLSGMGPERARLAAVRLIEDGAAVLVQLGVSGGLAPQLLPGDLVVADSVLLVDGGRTRGRWTTDGELARHAGKSLTARQIPAAFGPIASSPRPFFSPAEKMAVGQQFRALAVDMESAGVAMAAGEGGVPCFILRAVCDAADQSVPAWLFDTLNADGSVRFANLAGALVRRPLAVTELLRMRRRFRSACLALQGAWRLLAASDFPALVAGKATRR